VPENDNDSKNLVEIKRILALIGLVICFAIIVLIHHMNGVSA
jgi:hypothetical protein